MLQNVTYCCERIKLLGSLVLADVLNGDIEQAKKEYDFLLANVQNLGHIIEEKIKAKING